LLVFIENSDLAERKRWLGLDERVPFWSDDARVSATWRRGGECCEIIRLGLPSILRYGTWKEVVPKAIVHELALRISLIFRVLHTRACYVVSHVLHSKIHSFLVKNRFDVHVGFFMVFHLGKFRFPMQNVGLATTA
jgi:hypothetical protein